MVTFCMLSADINFKISFSLADPRKQYNECNDYTLEPTKDCFGESNVFGPTPINIVDPNLVITPIKPEEAIFKLKNI